jgi:hypothetical protein
MVIAIACALALPGCQSGTPEEPPARDSDGRPETVRLCYTDFAASHPAAVAFREVFREGRVQDRDTAIADLEVAAEESPQEEELAVLSGLANLWRVAEPRESEVADLAGLVTAATSARAHLERAAELCPTDHRIAAWLGPILVNFGRAVGDDAMVDEGMAVLQAGIDAYPSFVLFSKLLVFADRARQDPDFQRALDAVRENVAICLPEDPACANTVAVPHNVEGAMIFMGDVHAKAGDRDAALAAYESAAEEPDYGQWPYRSLQEERIATLDGRIASFETADEADDPVSSWSDSNQCSICHRQ